MTQTERLVQRTEGVQRLLDNQTTRLFSMTAREAQRLGCCVRCRRDVSPAIWPELDRREYDISAICPQCWDVLFPEQLEDCE